MRKDMNRILFVFGVIILEGCAFNQPSETSQITVATQYAPKKNEMIRSTLCDKDETYLWDWIHAVKRKTLPLYKLVLEEGSTLQGNVVVEGYIEASGEYSNVSIVYNKAFPKERELEFIDIVKSVKFRKTCDIPRPKTFKFNYLPKFIEN